MSELDKEMYRRQLSEELQFLKRKDLKVKSAIEEIELLEKNLKLEQDLHDSEFQNRKLQLWILEDKYHEMKKTLKQEETQNKKMGEMLDDLRDNLTSVEKQVEEKEALINNQREDLQTLKQKTQDLHDGM
jgi:chromosome segregation ATPase